jgi:hypothetical protein
MPEHVSNRHTPIFVSYGNFASFAKAATVNFSGYNAAALTRSFTAGTLAKNGNFLGTKSKIMT